MERVQPRAWRLRRGLAWPRAVGLLAGGRPLLVALAAASLLSAGCPRRSGSRGPRRTTGLYLTVLFDGELQVDQLRFAGEPRAFAPVTFPVEPALLSHGSTHVLLTLAREAGGASVGVRCDGTRAAEAVAFGYGEFLAVAGRVVSGTLTLGPAARCGDGAVLWPAETCDDGNTEAGDGCGADCAVEAGFRCAEEVLAAPSTCVSDSAPACANLLDDDGDGVRDYPADPGCTSADDPSEREPELPCDNHEDDDSDGLADYRVDGQGDPGCAGPLDDDERCHGTLCPQCDDGDDNDLDGQTDFRIDGGGDSDCSGPDDRSEQQGADACVADGQCDDGNACTVDVCAASGRCDHRPLDCDNGTWCDGPESCDPRVGCVPGAAPDCPGDACSVGSCDESAGRCVMVPQPAGTSCDDGDNGTCFDACDAGTCAGGPCVPEQWCRRGASSCSSYTFYCPSRDTCIGERDRCLSNCPVVCEPDPDCVAQHPDHPYSTPDCEYCFSYSSWSDCEQECPP